MVKNPAWDILFPLRCPVCKNAINKGQRVCIECKKKLPYIKGPICKKCGKPMEDSEKEYCWDCEKRPFHYVSGRSVFTYNKLMKDCMGDFKFRDKQEYGSFFAWEMAGIHKKWLLGQKVQVLIPVPVHRKKRAFRGYNQAEILAIEIGRLLSLPVLNSSLYRKVDTKPQKQLNDRERVRNLEQAFGVRKEDFVGYERAVLIDDIYTTGSTMEACTRELLKTNINEVFFLCTCIGKGL